jgi:hypothetical protein
MPTACFVAEFQLGGLLQINRSIQKSNSKVLKFYLKPKEKGGNCIILLQARF